MNFDAVAIAIKDFLSIADKLGHWDEVLQQEQISVD